MADTSHIHLPTTPELLGEGPMAGEVTQVASAREQVGLFLSSSKSDCLHFASAPASVSEILVPWTADPAAICLRPSPSTTSLCPPT
jgi:hypothetical protein